MRKQVEAWQQSELTDVTAKVVIYEAFVEGKLEAPKHLARTVHDLSSNPSMRNSGRERSGVSGMPSRRPSRDWAPFRNSRRRRSWESFWRLVFEVVLAVRSGTRQASARQAFSGKPDPTGTACLRKRPIG